MKSKISKRVLAIGIPALILVFFAGIVVAMSAAGKIDLAGVPVVGDILAKVTSGGDGTDAKNLSAGEILYNPAAPTVQSLYTSPLDIAVDGSTIYVADETGQKVYKVSSTGTVTGTYTAGQQVNGVVVNGGKVYVLEGQLAGTVTLLKADMTADVKIEVGHTPNAMAFKGTTAYVSNRFSNTVSVINLSNNTKTADVDVTGREPMALQIAGNKLFVACHLSDDAATAASVSSKVCVIDTATNKQTKAIALKNGVSGVKDLCLSPDGKTIYVSHVIGRYAYPASQLDRGWTNTNGFSIIDVASEAVSTTLMLDQVELGASNPWGIRVSEDGKKLVVAISGTGEAMLIDIDAMNAKIAAVKAKTGVVETIDKISDYLPFLDGCRERITLPGNGARSLEIASGKAYFGQYFSGDIAVMDLSTKAVSSVKFKDQPAADSVRLGQTLWNDANNSYQKWVSCASCHPEGRSDGMNWDELNDGIGNAKSTKSLVYSHRTPPTLATGLGTSGEASARGSFSLTDTLDENAYNAIDDYLRSLKPEPSPKLNRDGTLSASAIKGKAIYAAQNCASCHPAPFYTDMTTYTNKNRIESHSWDSRNLEAPPLVEVWRSGPWLHNGSLKTMKETVANQLSGTLSDADLTDLTNYVLSIGAEGELYGVEQIFGKKADGTIVYSDLVPGMTFEKFTIRKQSKDAPAAKVTFEVFDSSNNSLYKDEQTIGDLGYNMNKLITLKTAYKVPETLAKGAYIKVSFAPVSGTQTLATDLKIKY